MVVEPGWPGRPSAPAGSAQHLCAVLFCRGGCCCSRSRFELSSGLTGSVPSEVHRQLEFHRPARLVFPEACLVPNTQTFLSLLGAISASTRYLPDFPLPFRGLPGGSVFPQRVGLLCGDAQDQALGPGALLAHGMGKHGCHAVRQAPDPAQLMPDICILSSSPCFPHPRPRRPLSTHCDFDLVF